jgi:small GTP-binding protein
VAQNPNEITINIHISKRRAGLGDGALFADIWNVFQLPEPIRKTIMALDEDLKREIQTLAQQTQTMLDEFEQTKVNVALIGEPGVGKSSLMNAIVGRKVAQTGATGETTLTAQSVPHDEVAGVIFWDLPGCGTPNHPRETYIADQHLLENYDLFVLVTDKRIRQGDEWLYRQLCKEAGQPFFVVRTHFDQVIDEMDETEARARIHEDIRKQLSESSDLRVYIVALKGPREFDLGPLMEAIIDSLSGLKRDKVALAVAPLTEELLRKKRLSAEKIISRYALVSAANGFNPVPGLDVSVDIGVLAVMAKQVVAAYGLTDDQLSFGSRKTIAAGTMKLIREIAKPATEYLAREGILLILRRLGSGIASHSVARWVPFVGQAVASYLGYQLTMRFGMELIADCEQASRAVTNVLQEARNAISATDETRMKHG